MFDIGAGYREGPVAARHRHDARDFHHDMGRLAISNQMLAPGMFGAVLDRPGTPANGEHELNIVD